MVVVPEERQMFAAQRGPDVSFHVATAFPPQQGGGAGPPGGPQLRGLHHPHHGANQSIPPPHQQQPPPPSQSQHSGGPPGPAPTSTPPGPADMGKQGPPHLQGQAQMPQGGQMQLNFAVPNQQRPNQSQSYFGGPRGPTPRMPNHRGQVVNMPTNNVGQQIFPSHVPVPQIPMYSGHVVPTPLNPNQMLFAPGQMPMFSTQPRHQNAGTSYYPSANQQQIMMQQHPLYGTFQSGPQGHQFFFQGMRGAGVSGATGVGAPGLGTGANQQVVVSGTPPQMGQGGQVPMMPMTSGSVIVSGIAGDSGGPAGPVGGGGGNKQQRRRYALDIIDPNTMKNIDIYEPSGGNTPPRSGDSSARETPQPTTGPGDLDLAADFAARVAKVASESSAPSSAQPSYSETPSSILPSLILNVNGPENTNINSIVTASEGQADASISKSQIIALEESAAAACQSSWKPQTQVKTSNIGNKNISNKGNKIDISVNKVEDQGHAKVESDSSNIVKLQAEKECCIPPNVSINDVVPQQLTDIPAVSAVTQQIVKEHQSIVQTVESVVPQDVTPVVSALTNSPDVELIHHRSIPREQYPGKPSGISTAGGLPMAHPSPRRKRGDLPVVPEKASVPQSVALVPNISVISSQVTPAPVAEVKQREHSAPPLNLQLGSELKQQKKSETIIVDEPPVYTSVASKDRWDQDKSSRGREKPSQGRDTQGREKSQGQDREKSLQGRNKESPVPVVSISVAPVQIVSHPELVIQSIPRVSSKSGVGSTSPIISSEDVKHQSNGEALDVTEGKSTQKSKHKRVSKMRDFNRKGAEKEGTDMDAFSELPPEEVPPPPPLPPAPSSPSLLTAPIKNVAEKPMIKNEELPTDKEEEKLVAVRNEENVKVSAAALKEDTPVIENTPTKTASFNLKYNYKEDQWSPLNPDGKKKYEREFLMGLKNEPQSKKKPDNLPDIEVVLKEKQPRAIDLSRGPHDTFTPKFLAGSNSRGGPIPKRNSQSKAKGNKSTLIHVSLSLKEDVKLSETENAWRPGRMSKSNVASVNDARTAELSKKVRGVLNKLTPQKFQTLVEQVQSLPIDNSDRLQVVINLVFEKAVDEPSYSVAYAQMCKVLSDMQVPSDRKSPDEPEFVNFRKLLVNRCQHEFEKNNEIELNRDVKLKEIENTTDPEKKKELQLIYNEEERRVRMKSVGNIRFIGELFKLQMLTTNIMNRCIKKLLSDGDEESLECLCKLLATIGKDLENKKQDLGMYFSKMKEISNKRGAVSSRVRFMLQDVIELRQGKWVPRRDDSNPKTIDQIQREAEKESLESQMALNSAPLTPRRQDDRGSGNDRRKNRGGNMAEEGWSLAGRSNKNNNYLVDTTRLKQKVPEMDSISLGMRSIYTNWHTPQIKPDTSKKVSFGMVSTNLYDALQDMTGDEKKTTLYPSSSPRPGPGTCTPSPSMEKERMLAAFKINEESRMSHGHSVQQSSRSSSRDNSSRGTEDTRSISSQPLSVASIEDIHKSPESSVVPDPIFTSDQMSKKATLLLDEFINNSNLEETAQLVAETFGPSTIHDFLVQCINVVLERSSPARQKVGVLICHLIKENVVTIPQYLRGFAEMLESADDLTIDIPKIWLYFAEIIAPMMSSETLSFSDFRKVASRGSKLLPEVLELLVKDKGPAWILRNWNAANIKWTDFMEPDEVDKFVKQHKLEYMSGTGSSQSPSSPLSMDEIQKKLVQFLKQEPSSAHSFDQICDWIGANVGNKVVEPQFIRALMTALCESAVSQSPNSVKLNEGVLLNHGKFFQKYVDNKEELELQCLYAVQAFNHRLEHPQGLLCSIFQCLWENSIIPNESFTTWETSMDPCEQVGKGVALKSLTTFFTALREGEEESEES